MEIIKMKFTQDLPILLTQSHSLISKAIQIQFYQEKKKKKIAHCYFFHCFVYLRSHSTDALKPGFIWTSPHHLTHTSSPFSHTLIPLSSIGPAAPPPSVIIINTQPSRRQMLLAPNNTYIIAPNQHGTHHACWNLPISRSICLTVYSRQPPTLIAHTKIGSCLWDISSMKFGLDSSRLNRGTYKPG